MCLQNSFKIKKICNYMENGSSTILKKETISRLLKDIKEVMMYSKENEKIYYKHDEENVLIGYAMISGGEETPYENGYYLYKFIFPVNYPFAPPKVVYLTNDGMTRFHPNFYKNGTCCLSILNTWKGEPWTSCQTILSVLLSLSSLFQNDPLLLEPGVKEGHKDIELYNDIIRFKNIDFSILYILGLSRKNELMLENNKNGKNTNDMLKAIDFFKDNINELFEKNKEKILRVTRKLQSNTLNTRTIRTSIYHMEIKIDYISLEEKLK